MQRPTDMSIGIDGLRRLSRTELRARWVQELGGKPPASLGAWCIGARHRICAAGTSSRRTDQTDREGARSAARPCTAGGFRQDASGSGNATPADRDHSGARMAGSMSSSWSTRSIRSSMLRP